jgi:peptide/nickel transport system permease protein
VFGFVLRRLAWAIVLFLALTLYTYVLFFVIPGNNEPIRRGFRVDQGTTLRETVGIDGGSIVREYGSFVSHVLHGDFGVSQRNRQPVVEVIGRAAPVTMSLVIGGVFVWLLIAIPIGLISALKPRSLIDRFGMVFVLIGVSAHPLWIGLVLAYIFGFRLEVTPIGGYCAVFTPSETCGGPVQWAYHLLLPWIAFGAVFAAIYARMIRASVLDVYDADHVRTARAIGMSEERVLRTQVLRNALLPLVTMLGMDLGIAFGGAIFVERAFGLPGIGKLLISSLGGRDLPVILGIVVLVTTAILFFNLLVDLLYPFLDPRIGFGSQSQSPKARSKWLRGRAPTTVALGSPPSNRITVGSERTP